MRPNAFTVSSAFQRPVVVALMSDGTVQASGFSLSYTARPLTSPTKLGLVGRSACPASSSAPGAQCWGIDHGLCRTDGTCECHPGYYSEGCGASVMCPGHSACASLARVLVVAPPPLGSDAEGTGAILAPEASTASPKPFATLRAALRIAVNGSIIVISPGVYPSTSCGGVVQSKMLTITAIGDASNTALDCQGSARGMLLLQSTVALTDIRIRNARSTKGGALSIVDGTTTLTRVIVEASVASIGGAVATSGAAVITMDSCNVSKCSASIGGGIALLGDSKLLLANGSFVFNNSAADAGGGIAILNSSHLTGNAGSVVGNRASLGGNLYASGTNTSIASIVCAGGSAHTGGGLAVGAGHVSVTDVSVAGCVATGDGGAIFVDRGAVTATRVALSNCRATRGGGVFTYRNCTVRGLSFSVKSCSATQGGGVYVDGATQLTGVSIVNCSATYGGGVSILNADSQAAVVVTAVSIQACTASQSGGGVNAENTTIAFEGVWIAGNSATLGAGMSASRSRILSPSRSLLVEENNALESGGGFYLQGIVTLDGAIAQRNAARSGGAINCTSASIALIHVVLSGNAASLRGGGLASGGGRACHVVVDDILISNNTALNGAGAFIDGGSSLRAIGIAAVAYNDATMFGGGIKCNACVLLDHVWVVGNTAANGAGIDVGSGSTTQFRNLLIERNAARADGGGVSARTSTVVFDNCTIRRNLALRGGGLALAASVARSFSSSANLIVIQNDAVTDGGNVLVQGKCNISGLLAADGSADRGAGMFTTAAFLTAINFRLAGNKASDAGGGWYLEQSDVVASNVTVEGNTALRGGGMALAGSNVVGTVAQKLVVKTNTASDDSVGAGGGIAFLSGFSALSHAEVANNVAMTKFGSGGGAVFVAKFASANVQDARILRNVASGDNSSTGGGFSVEVQATLGLNNVTCEQNVADTGGGMYSEGYVSVTTTNFLSNLASIAGGAISQSRDGVLLLTYSVLQSNSAGFGGAVSVDRGPEFHISFSRFVKNRATFTGGSILCSAAHGSISDSVFIGLQVSFINGSYAGLLQPSSTDLDSIEGGAISISNSVFQPVAISRCTIVGMVATAGAAVFASSARISCAETHVMNGYGSALHFSSGTVAVLTYSVFSGNTAAYDGGSVYVSESEADIRNCAFSGLPPPCITTHAHSHTHTSTHTLTHTHAHRHTHTRTHTHTIQSITPHNQHHPLSASETFLLFVSLLLRVADCFSFRQRALRRRVERFLQLSGARSRLMTAIFMRAVHKMAAPFRSM